MERNMSTLYTIGNRIKEIRRKDCTLRTITSSRKHISHPVVRCYPQNCTNTSETEVKIEKQTTYRSNMTLRITEIEQHVR